MTQAIYYQEEYREFGYETLSNLKVSGKICSIGFDMQLNLLTVESNDAPPSHRSYTRKSLLSADDGAPH